MKTNLKTDFEIFNEAIVFAKQRGYTVPPLEWAVLVKGRDFGKSNSVRMWAVGLMYSEEFLKAFFGERLVPREEDWDSMYAITLWAQQVAFEHQGKLYAADQNRPYMHFPVYDKVADYDTDWAAKAPAEIVNAQMVTKKLQNMTASLAINTHRVRKVRVDNLTEELPAYKHHAKRMVEHENPFIYLKNYMDSEKRKTVSY
jgi:hypothetical protein